VTNHPRRQRDRLVEMTEQHVADLAQVSALRKHAEVGRYVDEHRAAVLDIVKASRETETDQ